MLGVPTDPPLGARRFPPSHPHFPSTQRLIAPPPASTGQKWHFGAFHNMFSPCDHINKKNLNATPISPHFP